MAAGCLWYLNLDVEQELADPHGYRPSEAMQARVAALRAQLGELVRPGDEVLEADAAPGSFAGRVGLAWAPTPSAVARLRQAGAQVSRPPGLDVLQRVNDRAFQLTCASSVLGAGYVTTVEAGVQALQGLSPSGSFLLKRAFGFAGRGHLRVDGPPGEAAVAWLRNSLRRGPGVLVEAFVPREQDYCLHGLLCADGTLHLGRPLRQLCDARGVFRGVLPVDAEPEGALDADEKHQLHETAEAVARCLGDAGYYGPFGIDAFRYRASDGTRLFQPLCEINARFSMAYGHSGLRPLIPAES